MSKLNFDLQALQAKGFHERKNTSSMHISEVFSEKGAYYLNEMAMYITKFNRIPNIIIKKNINCVRAVKWLLEKYPLAIKDSYHSMRNFRNTKGYQYDEIMLFLFEDLLMYFDRGSNYLKVLYRSTDSKKVTELIGEIEKFKIKKGITPEIRLITQNPHGLDTESLKISKPSLIIEDNYNDDFIDINRVIFKRLSKKKDKGLILLHGKPGTGKTSYIRYLIASLKKNVILLPPNMAPIVTNPDFINILITTQILSW